MVARRDISKEIAVARLKFLVAPGRRAGDFASSAFYGLPVMKCHMSRQILKCNLEMGLFKIFLVFIYFSYTCILNDI